MSIPTNPAFALGFKHGREDAEHGRCDKILRVLDMAPDDYSDGYRTGIVSFIQHVYDRWN
jgi:hypothetical protein